MSMILYNIYYFKEKGKKIATRVCLFPGRKRVVLGTHGVKVRCLWFVCELYIGQAWTWINGFKKEPMREKLKIL